MSKSFRPWNLEQLQLLPLSVHDFVADDHLARFIVNLVRDELDLIEITGSYESEKGQPPYHPVMMTALLLYSYCCGTYASRRIAKACQERTDFMMIVALDAPDFRTVSEFRRRHLSALSQLFVQVLKLCEKAGLVKLGHVALDGTKIKANASKHKAMSYGHMKRRDRELEAEVKRWLAAAEAQDRAQDKAFGADRRGDELPDWVADKEKRLARIREAKAALEAEARQAAAAKARQEAEAEEQRQGEARKKPGKKTKPASGEPAAKAQRNFTDPESRILKTKDGFIQGYNAQAAVDGEAQIIVAHDLVAQTSDQDQLVPLLDGIRTNLGRRPKEASADAGYCSEANLKALRKRRITGYVAVGRAKHPDQGKLNLTGRLTKAMRAKLRQGGWRSRYRLRKQIVEPVFGQIKQARGFRQFLMRGLAKVKAEWALICIAHNLTKLAAAA
jgi:transposase